MKLLRVTEQAFDLESQKRDILQEYIDDYETKIYRVNSSRKFSSRKKFPFFSSGKKTLLYINIKSIE